MTSRRFLKGAHLPNRNLSYREPRWCKTLLALWSPVRCRRVSPKRLMAQTQRVGRSPLPPATKVMPPKSWRKQRGDLGCAMCGGTYVQIAVGVYRCDYCRDIEHEDDV